MLVVADHHQHVHIGVVQLLGQVGDRLLVLLVALLELGRRNLLVDPLGVDPRQQVLIVGGDAVGADQLGVAFVAFAAAGPALRWGAQLRTV